MQSNKILRSRWTIEIELRLLFLVYIFGVYWPLLCLCRFFVFLTEVWIEDSNPESCRSKTDKLPT
jgi:hypothetical protein